MPHHKVGATKQAEYKDFTVDSLPEKTAAAGIRAGCVNTLCACMPEEFAAHVTGHESSSDINAYKVGLYKLNSVDPQLEVAWF